MTRIYSLLSALLGFAVAHAAAADEVRIALQSLGKVPADVVEKVRVHLEEIYTVHVEVLPAKELPASAFYRPRQRYRADKLLDWLESNTAATFTKVIGITAADISTTKGEVFDWGIFGLGQLGQRPCVISTFRLGRGVPRDKLLLRTQRVAAHEIGHTFGLEHCPMPGCMMSDAEGKISTVDNETGQLCEHCRVRVPTRKTLQPGS
jgi:archaemetzincin